MDERPKTILLVYIHGFKGDDTTFASFPKHSATALSKLLVSEHNPPVITPTLYPAFATRGSLADAVERFRAWLLEKVIDAEVARGTSSPTLSPGVGVVLCGHSMGGIVAAEACLGIFADSLADGQLGSDTAANATAAQSRNVMSDTAAMAGEANPWSNSEPANATTMPSPAAAPTVASPAQAFPRLLGVLAFDTPYLGISPGVVRYGAEEHYRQGKKWYDSASALFGPDGGAAGLFSSGASTSASSTAAAAAEQTAKSGGGWTWGKAALVAGAGLGAGAAALGAGYAGRNYLAGGYTWATEHLAFVGCLARDAELRARVRRIAGLAGGRLEPPDAQGRALDVAPVGFANLYTLLDPAATASAGLPPEEASATRTFCRLPADSDASRGRFVPAVNSRAAGEVQAHVAMFRPEDNPEYGRLVDDAAGLLAAWTRAWVRTPT